MLYDVDRRQYIENIPHSVEYDTWRSRLTDEQVAAIRGELRGRIDRDKILTSSFIPGSDWTGTVFSPFTSMPAGSIPRPPHSALDCSSGGTCQRL